MKLRLLAGLLLGFAISAFAQGGYQDGVDYFNANRLEEAKIILNNTLNNPATDQAVSYYYLGAIDLLEGNVSGAKANFDKGLAANPANALNHVGLGELALRAGDKKTAEEYFKAAEKCDKKDAAVYAFIARAYFNVNPTLYAKEIQKYIDKGFKVSKYEEPAIYMLQGDMQAGTNPGEAAGLYEMAMNQAEAKGIVNPEAYVKYANTYFHINPQFAIQRLVDLNEKLPTSALAQRELAEKYYENDQLTMAAEQYGKYMKNPNHFQRDEQRYAGLLFFGGKYEESLAVADNVLKTDPSNFYMWRMKMYDLDALKRYDKAKVVADKFFTLTGDFNAKDYETLGNILSEIKDYNGAVAAYEKAIAINPDKTDLLQYISECYANADDHAKALEAMKQYAATGHDKTNDYYILARRCFNYALTLPEGSAERTATAREGVAAIDKALEKAPESGSLWRQKAQLLQAIDPAITAEIAQCYEKMIDCYLAEPDGINQRAAALKAAYGNLAGYYLNSGDKATARGYYEKLLQLDPDNQDLKNYLKNF